MERCSNLTEKTSPNEQNHFILTFASTRDLLEYIYADLTRISVVSAADIVLHRFDNHGDPLRGKAAAQAHEEALVAATGGTLHMDVESIQANTHFGSVIGILRARNAHGEDLAVPFCGLWKFVDGKAIEHWENVAAKPRDIARWLANSRDNISN